MAKIRANPPSYCIGDSGMFAFLDQTYFLTWLGYDPWVLFTRKQG